MIRHLLLAAASTLIALDVEPAKLATADAAPLDPGTFEVAIGGTMTAARRSFDAAGRRLDRGGDLEERSLGVGLTSGMLDGVDAGITVGWTRITDRASDPDHGSGPTDAELAAKWRFWQAEAEDCCCAAALLPLITVPLGRGQDDDRLATASRYWTAGLVCAASGNAGRLAFNADCGYVVGCGSDEDRAGFRANVSAHAAVGVQLASWVQPEVELSWACDRCDDGPQPWALEVIAGAQFGLPCGRLGLGMSRVVDGVATDDTVSGIADLAIGF